MNGMVAGAVDWIILFVSGFFIGVIVAAPIGPVNLICIRRTLRYGPINGFLSGLGAALGDGTFAGITAFGLTAIYKLIEGYSFTIELIGGLLLLGFAVRSVTSHPHIEQIDDKGKGIVPQANSRIGVVSAIISTYALTITNPATLLGFAALFAGLGSFAAGTAGYGDAATVVLAVMAGSASWWLAVTAFTSMFHRQITDKGMRWINIGTGIFIGCFALFVLGNLAWKTIFA